MPVAIGLSNLLNCARTSCAHDVWDADGRRRASGPAASLASEGRLASFYGQRYNLLGLEGIALGMAAAFGVHSR